MALFKPKRSIQLVSETEDTSSSFSISRSSLNWSVPCCINLSLRKGGAIQLPQDSDTEDEFDQPDFSAHVISTEAINAFAQQEPILSRNPFARVEDTEPTISKGPIESFEQEEEEQEQEEEDIKGFDINDPVELNTQNNTNKVPQIDALHLLPLPQLSTEMPETLIHSMKESMYNELPLMSTSSRNKNRVSRFSMSEEEYLAFKKLEETQKLLALSKSSDQHQEESEQELVQIVQEPVEQELIEQELVEQESTEQESTVQESLEQESLEQEFTEQAAAGQVAAGQEITKQELVEQELVGQDLVGQQQTTEQKELIIQESVPSNSDQEDDLDEQVLDNVLDQEESIQKEIQKDQVKIEQENVQQKKRERRASVVSTAAQSILGDKLEDFTEKLAFIKKNIIMSLDSDEEEEVENAEQLRKIIEEKKLAHPITSQEQQQQQQQRPSTHHRRTSSLMDVGPTIARFMNQIGGTNQDGVSQESQAAVNQTPSFSPSSLFSAFAGPMPEPTAPTVKNPEIQQQMKEEEDLEELFDFTKVIEIGKNVRSFGEGFVGNGLRMFNDVASRVKNSVEKPEEEQQQLQQQQQQQQIKDKKIHIRNESRSSTSSAPNDNEWMHNYL